MIEEKKYADSWNVSAKYFYDKGYYSWMAEKLSSYQTVLEIGCGTGYSTLALAEKGYKVIAVDKNQDCIEQAEKLISSKNNIHDRVTFYYGDIAIDNTREDLVTKFDFDVVICWNVGSCWYQGMLNFYMPYMLEYGLTIPQIAANPESSYTELILWDACRLACEKTVDAHIIDRGEAIIDSNTKTWYDLLRKDRKFSEMVFDTLPADTVSLGGRILSSKGQPHAERKMNITFISALYKH